MSDLSWTGKCSSFGGPKDFGVSPEEGLGLIECDDMDEWWFSRIFLPPPQRLLGLARSLNPDAFYIAMRFAYASFNGIQGEILPGFSREQIRRGLFFISKSGNGTGVWAQAADWGPNLDTGRLIDCSPGLLNKLGAATDDILDVSFVEA